MKRALYNNFVSLGAVAGLIVGLSNLGACTSSSNNDGPVGGPVSGAADTHCAGKTQETSQASCHPTAGTGGDDAGTDATPPADDAGDSGSTGGDDAGAVDPGGSDFGDTLYNAEGDDDDCKYHVAWSATPVRQNQDITFTVTVTTKSDGKPATNAAPYVEVFLNDTHPAPGTHSVSAETSPGTYTIGPVKMDQPGQWTVRFHMYGDCVDQLDDSPHGHAAFYVKVP